MAKRRSNATNRAGKGHKNPGLESGELVGLGIQVASRFKDALDECAQVEGRKKRVIVERALDAYFRAAGIWPK